MSRIFNLSLSDAEYPIYISDDIFLNFERYLDKLELYGEIVFIVDEFIEKKYFHTDTLMRKKNSLNVYIVAGMKNNKTFYSALKIFEYLEDKNIARDAIIIAIGGGVIGDLVGFIASCWYRGVDLIHIPTTLLSSVDSCVGGKTAINFRNTVNAIGSYHHPKAILIDTKILSDLPEREISSGFGEIIKYAMLGCTKIMEILSNADFNFSRDLEILIELSLKEKEMFVKDDIRESARRLYLNFGHTIGHAIEFSTIFNGEESLRHGEGVGLGMLAVLRIGIELGYLHHDDACLLRNLLEKFSLPIAFPASKVGLSRDILVERVINLCFKDKKRTQDGLRLVLLDGIGTPFIYKTFDRELIAKGVMEVII